MLFFFFIIINLLYFCSFVYIGEKISKAVCIDSNLEKISNKYFQYPIISISILSFIVAILVNLKINITNIAIFFNIIFLTLGFYFLVVKLNYIFRNLTIKILKEKIFIILILFSYLLLTMSPITDADSLAYHAYFPKKILLDNVFSYDLYNFHEQLIGIVEFFYVIPLYLKSEITLQLVNIIALLSIYSIFYKILNKKKISNINFILLIILTCPIFYHLTYSAKPQLIFISLSLLIFCLINNSDEKFNINLSLFIFFILIFNFLGKPSFLISSFVLTLYFFYKTYNKINFIELMKIITFSLICFLPFVYFRYNSFGTLNPNFIFNNIPVHLPGYLEFWKNLTNAQHENLYPLSLFVPTSLSSISTSFGCLPFILILFLKIKKELIFPFLLLVLMFFAGIRENRFYLEPLLWLSYLLFLNIKLKNYKTLKFLKTLSMFQIIPSTLLLVIISLYFFLTNLNQSYKTYILKKHAYGYSANLIINSKISNNDKVVFNMRSLYYGNQNLIYPEFLNFTKDKFYTDKIIKENPIYIVLVDEKIENSFFKNCNVKKTFTDNIATKINRKSFFNKKSTSEINFYKLNSMALKKCF